MRSEQELGRLGLRLPPVGRSGLADGAKYHAFRALSRARRLLGGRVA